MANGAGDQPALDLQDPLVQAVLRQAREQAQQDLLAALHAAPAVQQFPPGLDRQPAAAAAREYEIGRAHV